jgi:hypothetical protein
VASPKILDEAMPSDDHPGAAVLLEPSQWSQPRLQAAMVVWGVETLIRHAATA